MIALQTPALSIRQPWAWAILHAGKDIENRSWPTKYRGPILIHAGKEFDGKASEAIEDAKQWARDAGIAPPSLSDFNLGGIVGRAEITGCVRQSESRWFNSGSFGFVLANVQPVPFIPCRGALGLFHPMVEMAFEALAEDL